MYDVNYYTTCYICIRLFGVARRRSPTRVLLLSVLSNRHSARANAACTHCDILTPCHTHVSSSPILLNKYET
jgi:hypothetical protein